MLTKSFQHHNLDNHYDHQNIIMIIEVIMMTMVVIFAIMMIWMKMYRLEVNWEALVKCWAGFVFRRPTCLTLLLLHWCWWRLWHPVVLVFGHTQMRDLFTQPSYIGVHLMANYNLVGRFGTPNSSFWMLKTPYQAIAQENPLRDSFFQTLFLGAPNLKVRVSCLQTDWLTYE